MKLAARIAFGASMLTLVLLGALHILSPEFEPSWHMISQYADGDYPWVLTLLFLSWAVSSWALAYALRPRITTKGGKVGLVFLAIAGIGEAMAAVFDINHVLHNMAGNIGIASLPVAAVLISRVLGRAKLLAHATWISVVLLGISFAVLMSTFVASGGDLESAETVPELPDGVIAFVGWANRLLVAVYSAWAAVMAWGIAAAAKPKKRTT
jgi:hypothetical protein